MDSSNTSSSAGEIGSRLGVRFYRYRGMLKRYWWLILLTVALGLAYEGWVIYSKPERFISVGKLSVRETGGEGTSRMVTGDASWYGTIRATIESPAVLDRASKSVVLTKPEYERSLGSVGISAENEQGTYIFAIKGTGANPEFTQFFVGSVMNAFMEKRREESREGWRTRLDHLVQNLERERTAFDEAQAKLNKFKDDNNVPFIENERQRMADELNAAKKDREELNQQIATYETLNAGGLLRNDAGAKPGGQPGVTKDADWIQTQKDLAVAKAELQERSQVWKPAHPRYQQLERDIRKFELQLDVLKKEADEGRKAALDRLKAELATKNTAIDELENNARNFARIAGQYDTLKGELDRYQSQFNYTRELIDKQRGESGGIEILGISQEASRAMPEPRNLVRHLLTGLIGGLLVGLVILFLLDRADDRLASSSEMIEQFTEPILGQIPDVADSRTAEGLPLLGEEDERYMFAEAFRSLRSSLIFMPNQTELKTLIITSAIPNEGKSTVASNLAITMANAGARVLLVDADLRRGDIAMLFETDGQKGLSNILRGEVPWTSCVQSLRNDHVHILPRGPVTNQSGELLLKPILSKLLEEWKAAYDLVIFNTAPILATDDTPTLAPNFDGTLMVIRASFTSARLTRNALNSLYQRQVNVLGLIMNCVDTELPDYYYYRYPKYYAA
jgi:succinoglycan biosynthesis transport protein ExoP